MPGLDGLRAIAVLAVLLYHAGISWMPGGFLGVDVFFVISGFLITSLLLAEWGERGRIDLKAFWMGRARRLLPGLFVMLGGTAAFAVVFLPGEVAGLRGDLLAALGYVTNWYFIFEHQSYFEAMGRPPLLRHLWSLAVEEQFYLLWPPVFVVAMLLLRRYGTLVLVVAGAVGSALLMAHIFQPGEDPSRVYFGTDTRAATLLAGVAFALLWPPCQRRARLRLGGGRRAWYRRRLGWAAPLLLDTLILAALGALVWTFATVGEQQPALYRGGFAAVAAVAAVLVAAVASPRSRLGALLGLWPLRWVGLRSYGIYLWHWPVLMVTRPGLDVELEGWRLLALQISLTFVLAALSYSLVERPIRSGALGRAWETLLRSRGLRRWRLRLAWSGGLSSVVVFCAVVGVALASADPPKKPDYLAKNELHIKNDTPEQQRPSQPSSGASKEPQTTAEQQKPAPEPEAATEKQTTTPEEQPTVTAIGDSVMISASSALQQEIPNLTAIDAEVGLHLDPAIALLQQRRASGELGDVVVVHLGTNGGFSREQFDSIMDTLSGVDRVVFVNDSVPRFWEEPNNAVISEGVQRYPNATLVDWYSATYGRPELFRSDGVHPTPEGARLYAELIRQAVEP